MVLIKLLSILRLTKSVIPALLENVKNTMLPKLFTHYMLPKLSRCKQIIENRGKNVFRRFPLKLNALAPKKIRVYKIKITLLFNDCFRTQLWPPCFWLTATSTKFRRELTYVQITTFSLLERVSWCFK